MEKDGWIIDNFTMISDEIKVKKDEDNDDEQRPIQADRQRQKGS